MKIEDLIGKIIWNYDKGRTSTILDDGRWKSDVEYDDECEENYIITDIVKTTDEFIIIGKLMRSYDDALDAYHIEEIENTEPIGLFGIDDISNLLEKEPHSNETEGLEVGMFLQSGKTHNGACNGTQPDEREQRPAPIALRAQRHQRQRGVRAGYVPVDGRMVPMAQALLPFRTMSH